MQASPIRREEHISKWGLKKEVYMDIPISLDGVSKIGNVCRLLKSRYGLNQSPRAWFARFTRDMVIAGYSQCHTDHTLFMKHNVTGRILVLRVYVMT